MPRAWVGTSGFFYKDWIGRFYPRELPSASHLKHFSTFFPTVEINNSFYHLPLKSTFKKWAADVPADFRFFVKGSRYLTQFKRLRAPAEPLRRFNARLASMRKKLAGILWQFPRQFDRNDRRLAHFLEALKKHPRTRQVFEFRHPSWFMPEIASLLKRHGAAFCHADMPDFYKQIDIPETADFIYVRRHGPDPGQRYRHSYSDAQIKADARRIRQWLKSGKDVFVYFNNDTGGAAIGDAQRLIRSLG